MKRKYKASNLFVGKIMMVSGDLDYPPDYKTELKYIFEGKSIEDVFFREIFSGNKMETEINTHKDGYFRKLFDTPYIIELERYTEYFPCEYDEYVCARDLLFKINDINSREVQQKLIKKQ